MSDQHATPGDLESWAEEFWTQLHRIDETWNVSELIAKKPDHRLVIEDLGAGRATVIVARKEAGHYDVIARHPFTLSDRPATVAAEVVYLVSLPHHAAAIDLMCKDAFLHALRLSVEESNDALDVRRKMERWARKLLPYLEQDATLTVADALASYRRDHRR